MSTVTMDTLIKVREELLDHPVYQMMQTPDHVRIFMQHHVFAVWDFMSLLKRLQQDLTCTTLPWVPSRNSTFARFINEIVLGEETDEDGHGGFISHFELYVEAMEEAEADTGPIRRFIQELAGGKEPLEALRTIGVPASVQSFVENTLHLATQGSTHEVCASFFFGREDIIPDMFQVLVDTLGKQGKSVDRLLYYLHRHIELDGDEHGPLAEKLLASLCNTREKLAEAHKSAQLALESRISLWDGVLQEISP